MAYEHPNRVWLISTDIGVFLMTNADGTWNSEAVMPDGPVQVPAELLTLMSPAMQKYFRKP